MRKARVFIGSSTEGLLLARAVEEHLSKETEPVLWTNNVFVPSSTTIENLEKMLDTVEFGVLVITSDDVRIKRDSMSEVPRDNVVFELGLLMGRLGRSRVFIVTDQNGSELPTDLLGVTKVTYDSARTDKDELSALSPAASQILRIIRRAARQHVAVERVHYRNTLLDEDQFLYAVASWPSQSKAITISLPHTKWVWQLFPALLCWRLARSPVLVQTVAASGDATNLRQETARRTLLRDLGIQLDEMPDIKKMGLFRQAEYPADSEVIVCSESLREFSPYAIQYDGMAHSQAVLALVEGVAWPEKEATGHDFVPELIPCDVADIIAALRKGVHQYSSPGVSMELGRVRTKELYLMSPYARAYKQKQLGLLSREFRRVDMEPFCAAAVRLMSGERSIITPPVVEAHEIGPVVVEGTTRATFCRDNGIADFPCIIVSHVGEPLPSVPVPIDEVAVTERSLTPAERMEGFNYNLFRHVERAVHPY